MGLLEMKWSARELRRTTQKNGTEEELIIIRNH